MKTKAIVLLITLITFLADIFLFGSLFAIGGFGLHHLGLMSIPDILIDGSTSVWYSYGYFIFTYWAIHTTMTTLATTYKKYDKYYRKYIMEKE